ncbi:MAG: hypothetical protein A2286_00290 [Gammaproteobacteria bacterium RIFOXYA12_FULL_61_12]|nr:MAG: hypothetical protein A2514_11270 [Gammaproteobacteria bacterium RIFOXYD12_FULL_61_37]OGT94030.1 MAG: hypothetical protein A2286_00290 [Gammaproteobacteria bacterium RIFOXYA12_FULL_61_12]
MSSRLTRLAQAFALACPLFISGTPFAQSPSPPTDQIQQSVQTNASLWRLPEELIRGVIHVESRGNPGAVSPKGALGLMQVVPGSGGRETWKLLYSKDYTPSRELLKDPHANITIGSAYLAYLYHRHFASIPDPDVRVMAALAAYNWGPGRVEKMLGRHGMPKSMTEMGSLLANYAPRETARYVIDVITKTIEYARADLSRTVAARQIR